MQAKLLRALQERKVRPVGGDAEVALDVRVVAATNRDLEAAVDEGRFREDLFYRINVVHVALPPLRARGGDVLLLAQHFLEHFAARAGKSGHGALERRPPRSSSRYAWPGNVRELQNCIERAVALARFEQITVDDLPEKIRDYRRSHVLVASDDPAELVPMEEVERRYILRVLEAAGGNKTRRRADPRVRPQDALPQARALRASHPPARPRRTDPRPPAPCGGMGPRRARVGVWPGLLGLRLGARPAPLTGDTLSREVTP